jgi:predicted nuclease of predicted toxin-antitoxin system
MRILIDMNLPPQWQELLRREGFDAMHWSAVGNPGASDEEILSYAEQHRFVVLTHDLDFSAILAATVAARPSVMQVRAQDTLSMQFREVLVQSLRRFQPELEVGAIVVVEQWRARVRILPLAGRPRG